jgi:hypothetical protein
MKTHIITKDQLDSDNNYIGSTDLDNFEGHLESDGNLGYIKFKSLNIKGSIYFKAGDGIRADLGIRAGWGIEADLGIRAGWGIKAGDGIRAGRGIEAGDAIEAGRGIRAGWGIRAGLSINAKFVSAKLRIFAGTCHWKIPEKEEMQIRAKLVSGIVSFGELVEPEEFLTLNK